MEWHVAIEAHDTGANIYLAGDLAALAAERIERAIEFLPEDTRVIRLDLRAVELIDPDAFVTIVRALNCWRDSTRGQLHIKFPERTTSNRRVRLHLVPLSPSPSMTMHGPNTIFDSPAVESAAF